MNEWGGVSSRLIQDSLGGNTRTWVIANLSPHAQCVDETVSTLRFADRAKQVSTTLVISPNIITSIPEHHAIMLMHYLQVMVYIRPSEKPVVDHLLIEKLQREVSQLRGLILKLKESGANNVAAARAFPDELLPLRFQGMTIQEVAESLEEEGRKDRAEVSSSSILRTSIYLF